jgi:hypothetical protein
LVTRSTNRVRYSGGGDCLRWWRREETEVEVRSVMGMGAAYQQVFGIKAVYFGSHGITDFIGDIKGYIKYIA